MSNDQWHITHNGNTEGPLSYEELQQRVQTGVLGHSSLVWQDGMADWVKAGTLKGLFQSPPPPPLARETGIVLVDKSTSAKVDHIANRRMIFQLREDASDCQLLWAEAIRVGVRLNPVNIQIYNFLDFINQITDGTPRHETARLVLEAMQQVDLTNAAPMLDESLDGITSFGPFIIEGNASLLLEVWPESAQLIQHSWLYNTEKDSERLRQQLRGAVQAHRQDLIVIQKHYRQLQEYHSRYHGIMTRSDAWDYILGFAAGIFGGGIGLIGAQVWDDWRGKSDAEFAQLFGNAVEQFCTAALAFTQKTEQEVESVVSRFLPEMQDFQRCTIAALEKIADIEDISAIYRKLHGPDTSSKIDEDGKQFFEIVLSNLREQNISSRSESNIREMLGI